MKKHKKLFCLLLSIILFASYCPTAQAQENTEETEKKDQTGSPYFYIETTDPALDRLPLKDTKVNANISGMLADIRVTQTYANEGQNPINASYVFPASTKVTVHGMKMQVGNQLVTARIQEKEEAKETFEKAKSEGKNTSLLEQKEANVFSMRVANIMPGDVISIELHYTELITPEDGVYQFVFPTVVGPRYVSLLDNTDDNEPTDNWVAAPYRPEGSAPSDTYSIEVNLSSGIPITDLSSSSHSISIERHDDNNAVVTLADPADYAGNRDFILNYGMQGREIESGLLLDTNGTENFFMLAMQPPKRIKTNSLPPMEYIFILDVSGSMFGFPLDTAKELIQNLVSGLSGQDTFNLVLFSNDALQMAPSSVPATEKNINKAIQLINAQKGGGGTELAPALETALAIPMDEERARSVVIITDGFLYGEDRVFDLIDDHMDSASFFSFGIGSSVNRNLIEGIAESGQGEPFVVTDKEHAAETAERFRTYISSPVLTDIKVSFDGFDAYDVEPAVVSTLFARKPIVLLGKYHGDAAGTVTISGRTADGPYSRTLDLSEAAKGSISGTLPYLWARKHIARLTDYGINKNNPEIKEEVTQLGLTYSMLTPYTSFVAVSEVIRNPDGEGTDVDQALPLPLQVSNLAVGCTIGAEPEGIFLVVILFAAVLCRVYSRRKNRRPNTAFR